VIVLNPDFIADLRKRFHGDIRLDPASRVLYSTDASMYQIEPLGAAIPKNQEDLLAAVELAAQYKIPILPRGSGSSLGGQAIGEALILDCSRYLDSIVEINPETHSAVVEPGVILATLNRAAAKHGLMFGPDPASAERATLGGVIGNNATGAHSILYGMTADHLVSADVILSDGSVAMLDDSIFDTRHSNLESRISNLEYRISNIEYRISNLESQISNLESRISNIVSAADHIRQHHAEAIKQNYPQSWRNSAGYRLNYLLPWSPSKPPQWDSNNYGLTSTVYRSSSAVNLASLLAGSEGTLAVIRRATVNLVPKPKHTILGILAYDSIPAACDDVLRLLEFNPSAIELIPQMILRLARGVPAYARQMSWVIGDPAALLVVEFSGSSGIQRIESCFSQVASEKHRRRVDRRGDRRRAGARLGCPQGGTGDSGFRSAVRATGGFHRRLRDSRRAFGRIHPRDRNDSCGASRASRNLRSRLGGMFAHPPLA